jgi:predicted metal-dependent HD superfamily phosphohydrolase
MNLHERWGHLCQQAGASGLIEETYQALAAHYASPSRAYHNLEHLAECLAAFDTLSATADHPLAVEFALWFHDVIYDTHRTDNEARSAEYATERLTALGLGTLREVVAALIMMTRHAQEPATTDDAVMLDADLAILAAAPARFAAYDAAIREEYAWVDDTRYRAGRRDVLAAFLARPHIYQSRRFRAECEEAARANLRHALARLAD